MCFVFSTLSRSEVIIKNQRGTVINPQPRNDQVPHNRIDKAHALRERLSNPCCAFELVVFGGKNAKRYIFMSEVLSLFYFIRVKLGCAKVINI